MSYGNYRGRCVGRLLHFLCEYRIPFYSDVIFQGPRKGEPDVGAITLRDKLFATYKWDGDTDVPTFKFYGASAPVFEQLQVHYKEDVLKLDELMEQSYGNNSEST